MTHRAPVATPWRFFFAAARSSFLPEEDDRFVRARNPRPFHRRFILSPQMKTTLVS